MNLVPYKHGFVVALQYFCFQSLLKVTMSSKEGFDHPGDGDIVKKYFDIFVNALVCFLDESLMGRLYIDLFPEQLL